MKNTILENLDPLMDEIREVNQKWHINEDGSRKDRDPDFYPRCILLMGTELSEAFEYLRKGGGMDNHLPEYPGEAVEMADLFIRGLDYIIFHEESQYMKTALVSALTNGLETERGFEGLSTIETYGALDLILSNAYSDAISVPLMIYLVILYCESKEYNLYEIVKAKTAYNRNRADHKIENRSKEGGKQF